MDARSSYYLNKFNNLDNEHQHLIHYHEGYRETAIVLKYGEEVAFDKFGIDYERYCVGGARAYSYNEGKKDAIKDLSM